MDASEYGLNLLTYLLGKEWEESNIIINPFRAVVPYSGATGMVPNVAGRPDGPCDPRAPVQSLWGPGLGVPSRSPGLPSGDDLIPRSA